MRLQDIEAAWNAQAEGYNTWDTLGADEMVEFTISYVTQQCADICRNEGAYSDCIDMAIRCAEAIKDT